MDEGEIDKDEIQFAEKQLNSLNFANIYYKLIEQEAHDDDLGNRRSIY